jgi:general secretion pathway protein L
MTLSTPSEHLDRARELVADLLDNWRQEIAAVVQDITRVVLRGSDHRTIVTFDGNAIAVPELARTGADATRDVVLELPQDAVLHAQVRMPKTSRRVLAKALHHEVSRLSPIAPERLYFDFAAQPAGAASSVELRIVKRETVDAAVAQCHAARLQVGEIGFVGDARPANWQSFPVDRMAYVRCLWRRWHIPVLTTLALMLAAALIPAAYVRGLERAGAVADQFADAQINADLVEHLRDRARIALAESEALSRLRQAPLRVAMLADLARILPDGTWVTELTIEGDKLRLEGFSRSASDLIALFDHSSRFANAQFTAPLTREAQASVERFDLALDIKQANR